MLSDIQYGRWKPKQAEAIGSPQVTRWNVIIIVFQVVYVGLSLIKCRLAQKKAEKHTVKHHKLLLYSQSVAEIPVHDSDRPTVCTGIET